MGRKAAVLAVLAIAAVCILYGCGRPDSFPAQQERVRLFDFADDASKTSFQQIKYSSYWHEMTHEIIIQELGRRCTFSGLNIQPGSEFRFELRLLERDFYNRHEVGADARPVNGEALPPLEMRLAIKDDGGNTTEYVEKVVLQNNEGQLWTDIELPLKANENITELGLAFDGRPEAISRYIVEIMRPEVRLVNQSLKAEAGRRRVILITLDTTRADYLGCYGNRGIKTPNIDSFAAESVLFENAYSTANCTRPAHASIFMSLYLKDHKVSNNYVNMPEDDRVLAKLFKDNGYKTAAFVSSANFEDKESGFYQGFFDYYYYDKVRERRAEDTNYYVYNWLNGHLSDDFFIWIHYFDPHSPYIPPYPFNVMYNDKVGEPMRMPIKEVVDANPGYFSDEHDIGHYRSLYKGEITYLDSQLGMLFDKLKKLGMYDDTLIVITADHGEGLGEHGMYFAHTGMYDEVVKVPLLIKTKGGKTTGVRKALASLVDIYPTVLGIEGIRNDLPVRGKDLGRVIDDPGAPGVRKFLYAQHAGYCIGVIRSEDYKLISDFVDMDFLPTFRVVKDRRQLFRISDDPAELRDISELEPVTRDELSDELARFWKDVMPLKAEQATDEEYLEKMKSLGYVQ